MLPQLWKFYDTYRMIDRDRAISLCQQFRELLRRIKSFIRTGVKEWLPRNRKAIPPHFDLYKTSLGNFKSMILLNSSDSNVFYNALDEVNYLENSAFSICEHARKQFVILQQKGIYLSRNMELGKDNLIEQLEQQVNQMEDQIWNDRR